MLTGKRIVIILISLCLIVSCGRHQKNDYIRSNTNYILIFDTKLI